MKCKECLKDIDDAVIHDGYVLCYRCTLDLIITKLAMLSEELQVIKSRLDYYITFTKNAA